MEGSVIGRIQLPRAAQACAYLRSKAIAYRRPLREAWITDCLSSTPRDHGEKKMVPARLGRSGWCFGGASGVLFALPSSRRPRSLSSTLLRGIRFLLGQALRKT